MNQLSVREDKELFSKVSVKGSSFYPRQLIPAWQYVALVFALEESPRLGKNVDELAEVLGLSVYRTKYIMEARKSLSRSYLDDLRMAREELASRRRAAAEEKTAVITKAKIRKMQTSYISNELEKEKRQLLDLQRNKVKVAATKFDTVTLFHKAKETEPMEIVVEPQDEENVFENIPYETEDDFQASIVPEISSSQLVSLISTNSQNDSPSEFNEIQDSCSSSSFGSSTLSTREIAPRRLMADDPGFKDFINTFQAQLNSTRIDLPVAHVYLHVRMEHSSHPSSVLVVT